LHLQVREGWKIAPKSDDPTEKKHKNMQTISPRH
jgi:hypothetical protein